MHDPRTYTSPQMRRKAALARGGNCQKYCRGCRMLTLHAHGSRYAYCVYCLRNQDTPHTPGV